MLILIPTLMLTRATAQSLEKLSVAMLSLQLGPAPLVWLLDCVRGAHLGHGDLKRFASYGQVLAPDKVRDESCMGFALSSRARSNRVSDAQGCVWVRIRVGVRLGPLVTVWRGIERF